jgi:hypothetical protein
LQIPITIDAAPAGAELMELHVKVYNDENHSAPASPENEGATPQGTTVPITHPLDPNELTNARNLVVVWAEYRVYIKDSVAYDSCSGSGSSRIRQGRAVSPVVAEQLEAVPKAYRVSPNPPTGGTGGSALLAGISEAVLHYVPEASTPTEPFWQARTESGPVREWALRLLHRHGGFGAVLSAVGFIGNREIRLTWVCSDWRFHTDNRLTAESDEVQGLALLVRPA